MLNEHQIHVEGWGNIEAHTAHKELVKHLTTALQRAQEGNHGAAMYHAEKAHMFAKAHHDHDQAQQGGHHNETGAAGSVFLRRQAEGIELEEHFVTYNMGPGKEGGTVQFDSKKEAMAHIKKLKTKGATRASYRASNPWEGHSEPGRDRVRTPSGDMGAERQVEETQEPHEDRMKEKFKRALRRQKGKRKDKKEERDE